MTFLNLKKPVLLTIGTCNRRAGIVALIESFRLHHPAAEVFVCLVDHPIKETPNLDIPAITFFADELLLPEKERFLFKYDVFELCCALKPFAMSHLFSNYGVDGLLYLDSDIVVFNHFWDQLEQGWSKYSILLTPHLVYLPKDLAPEIKRSLVQHGGYNAGFIAAKRDPQAESFLECWADLLRVYCISDPMNNIYVDQRWLDLLTASSDAVGTLRDPGLNVGYWNMHERHVTRDAQKVWRVNNSLLKFFHFSGFDRSTLTTKLICESGMALQLAHVYGELLDQAKDSEFRKFDYGWNVYSDGTPIKAAHRDLILSNATPFNTIKNPFLLSSLYNWEEIDKASTLQEPVRLSQRYSQQQDSYSILSRLRKHPVIGTVWKLWARFINPSLNPGRRPNAGC